MNLAAEIRHRGVEMRKQTAIFDEQVRDHEERQRQLSETSTVIRNDATVPTMQQDMHARYEEYQQTQAKQE